MPRFKHFSTALLLLFTATTSLAAPKGDLLYEKNCGTCHGLDGSGGVGVPLSLPSFQASVDDHFLFQNIRYGRPGRVMPAFSDLSDAQVNAIVRHIRSLAPHIKPVVLDNSKVISGDIINGKKLYSENCGQCHGANGEGGHGTGVTFSRPRDLPIIAPALNNAGFLAAASDEMIRHTITYGRQGTPMQAFGRKGQNEQEINDIVAYIRTFENSKHWQPVAVDEATITMESEYGLEESVENLKRAAVGKNFKVIRIQNLEDGMFPEAEQDKRSIIVYFCNFSFVNRAINIDPRVGLFLPCRITLTEHDGVVSLTAINPRYMSRFYNNSELDEACSEMYDIYIEIMEEAIL
ncbi:MAG: c-type cytochrome [Gammaproteobacteria bacterium]|nr:c-type cytochrome [Gammaproteobacteria bacterium]